MGNQLVNMVLNRWLEDRPDLVPVLDCAACTLALERPAFAHRWRSYKCCTFQPFVANFLAGAMLEAGLDALALKASKATLQPLGAIPTAGFREHYLATPEDSRGEEHLCSYFDEINRRCTVWSHRPGECSTFFCSDNGRSEREVYSQRLFHIETAVAQMALVELGFAPEAIAAQVEALNQPILAPAAL
jgi:Fe-S-cluster containining protein